MLTTDEKKNIFRNASFSNWKNFVYATEDEEANVLPLHLNILIAGILFKVVV